VLDNVAVSSVYSVYTEMTDTTVAAARSKETPTLAQPLRVVIPGGEGHLGRILARHFARRGHAVTTLSRSAGEADSSKANEKHAHWRSLRWDGKSTDNWVESLEDADVLINLAGRTVNCRYNSKNREEILRSRVDSTRILGQAIQGMPGGPRVWLNASTATVYRHSFDREMDEATGSIGGNEPGAPATWQFSIDVARRWEEAFFGFEIPTTRKIALRTAMVMASEVGGAFEAVLRLVQIGLGGAWGSGRQYVSWIHEIDFVRAVEFLIEPGEISGTVNVAAPTPLPNQEFMSALRKAWGIGIGSPATEWMLEIGAFCLRTETELLLKSRRVVPGVLRKHGFAFRFPTWPKAADDLVRRWRMRNESVG
jgi:uncharacterized protein (TIGR01777 family)